MMKTKSFLLVLALTGSALSVASPTFAATAGTASGAADTPAEVAKAELNERLARLWADRPDYVALLQPKESPDKQPRLVSTAAPEVSKALRRDGKKGTILVSFFVGEDGRVEAARVLESADERFNKPTLAAILKWKFLPATRADKPVKASMVVPMVL